MKGDIIDPVVVKGVDVLMDEKLGDRAEAGCLNE